MSPVPRLVSVVAAPAVALLLAACTPALNWRELRPDGSGLVVLFPCKPDSESRSLPMGGSSVHMTVWVCETGGARYALSRLDAGDAPRAEQALRGLQQAAARTLGVAAVPAAQPVPLPGMRARTGERLDLAGRTAGGTSLQQALLGFTDGGVVYQATVFGERLPAEGVDGFFSGIGGLPAR